MFRLVLSKVNKCIFQFSSCLIFLIKMKIGSIQSKNSYFPIVDSIIGGEHLGRVVGPFVFGMLGFDFAGWPRDFCSQGWRQTVANLKDFRRTPQSNTVRMGLEQECVLSTTTTCPGVRRFR